MRAKTDIFVDAAMKPYNFYLCPPLDRSQRLIKMIEENGGQVVNDFLQNCIIVSSRDYKVPEDLKSAHIYSYEVIQDSANRGAQQEFANYLIHIPTLNNDSVPHQYSDNKHSNLVGIVDTGSDDYHFANLASSLTPHGELSVDFQGALLAREHHSGGKIGIAVNEENEEDEEDEEDEDGEEEDDEDEDAAVGRGVQENSTRLNDHPVNQVNNTETELVVYNDEKARYFNKEDDDVLIEEVRKRHWMGMKGHHVYEIIAKLPYFVKRGRTPSSLRERMRTMKYNIGYVYKTDSKNKLLTDENGNYIKTTNITVKLVPYTAEDDLILCKTIYLKLDMVTDEQGFESLIFPTNFFDKFSNVYVGHTPESWRQRYKNYISVFGIANYLKYYILEVKQNRKPLPANTANKEWLQARKHIRKTDCPRLYFPNVPQENSFIDENIEYTCVPGYDEKIFEFTNPFRKNKKKSEEFEEPLHNKKCKHSTAGDNDISKQMWEENLSASMDARAVNGEGQFSKDTPENGLYSLDQGDEHNKENDHTHNGAHTPNKVLLETHDESAAQKLESIQTQQKDNFASHVDANHSISQTVNEASIHQADHTTPTIETMENPSVLPVDRPSVVHISGDSKAKEAQNADQAESPVPMVAPRQGEESSNDSKGGENGEISKTQTATETFVDEPTTQFQEIAFLKSLKKHGAPIALSEIPDKNRLIEQIQEIFDQSGKKIAPRELSAKLSECGVKEYYTVFLIYRCHSSKKFVLESLLNYINTDGRELLLMKPGIWSNKAIEYYNKHDPKCDALLKEYHGEKRFNKQSKWVQIS